MNTPHVLHELSAYVDGECRTPERIARHLQSCPSCARRHLELLTISAGLQALSAPAPSPAFLARVLVRTEEPAPDRVWFRGWAPRLAAAACVAALALAGTWQLIPRHGAIQPPETVGALPLQVNFAWRDDAQVVEAFGRLLDAGATLDVFGDIDEAPELEDAAAVTVDSVLELLADEAAGAEYSGAFAPDDFAALLDALAEEDVHELSELLTANGNEV